MLLGSSWCKRLSCQKCLVELQVFFEPRLAEISRLHYQVFLVRLFAALACIHLVVLATVWSYMSVSPSPASSSVPKARLTVFEPAFTCVVSAHYMRECMLQGRVEGHVPAVRRDPRDGHLRRRR